MAKTDWAYLYRNSGGVVAYRRVGPLVMLRWRVFQQTSIPWVVSAALPSWARPELDITVAASGVIDGSLVDHTAMASISTGGKITLQSGGADTINGRYNVGQAVWAWNRGA